MYAFVIWIRTHALSKVHNHDFLSICHHWFLSTKPENKLHTWCTPIHLGDYRSGDQLKVWYVGNWHLLCLMTKRTGGRHHHLYSYLPLRVTGNSDSKESRLRSSRFVIEQFSEMYSPLFTGLMFCTHLWCFSGCRSVECLQIWNCWSTSRFWMKHNKQACFNTCFKWRCLFVPLNIQIWSEIFWNV